MFKMITAEEARKRRNDKINKRQLKAILRRVNSNIKDVATRAIGMEFTFYNIEVPYRNEVIKELEKNGYKVFVVSEKVLVIYWEEEK